MKVFERPVSSRLDGEESGGTMPSSRRDTLEMGLGRIKDAAKRRRIVFQTPRGWKDGSTRGSNIKVCQTKFLAHKNYLSMAFMQYSVTMRPYRVHDWTPVVDVSARYIAHQAARYADDTCQSTLMLIVCLNWIEWTLHKPHCKKNGVASNFHSPFCELRYLEHARLPFVSFPSKTTYFVVLATILHKEWYNYS